MGRYSSKLLVGATAAMAFSPANLHAQTTGQDEAATPAATTEDAAAEILVTAQRRSESLSRTPVAVSVVGGEDLQKQAIVSESDLQTAVPGLTVKAGSTSDQLNYSIRGQSVDAFSGVRPGVLPYFNEIQVGGFGTSSAFYDLQSVQVLRGPQGTLFGRNATGGAVLFTTAKPTKNFEGYVSLRAGNYDLRQAEGAINAPLVDDKVILRLAGFIQRRDGFQFNLFDGSRVGDVKREGGRATIRLSPTSSLTNDLVVDYFHSGGESISGVLESVYPVGFNNAPAPANFLFSPALDSLFGAGAFAQYVAAHPGVDPDGIIEFARKQRERGPYVISVGSPLFNKTKNWILSNITALDVGANTEFRNIFGYTDLLSRVGADFDGSPYTIDERGEQGGRINTRQISNELQLIGKAWADRLSYVTGIYLSKERTTERSLSVIFDLLPFIPPINQINSGVTTNKTFAPYAQGTFDLSGIGIDGLSLIAGGRFTYERVKLLHRADDVFILNPAPDYVTPQSRSFKKFSWQLGLQQQINPDLMVYATSRSSFRSGGINFFAAPRPGLGSEGGSQYALEQATDVEVGLKFAGRLGNMPARFNLAAYHLWVKDIQRAAYVQIEGAPAVVTVNVPRTKIKGVEVDGSIKPAYWLNLGGSVNYTDPRFTKNQVRVLGDQEVAFGPFPDVAKWSGVAYAEAAFPLTEALRLSSRGDVYSQSGTYYSSTAATLTPGTRLPAYTLVNLRASIEHESGWSLAGLVKNVTDKVYYVGGLPLGALFTTNTVIPGDPRTYLVEVRYKF